MKEFFGTMDAMHQAYWYIALGVSLVFIIQSVMTFIGSDADTGVHADFDGNLDGGESPFQLFSLRNLINFLLGFGWTGATLYNAFSSKILVAVVAVVIGLVFVAVFFVIFRTLMKFAEDNTFKIEETIGKTGDVYLKIPAKGQGKGKVFISVRGSTHELNAITRNEESIEVGVLIKVVDVENGILIVVPFG